MTKIILDLCGGTGSWAKPYKEAGYDVRTLTLPDHDVRLFEFPKYEVYGILAAPPCTEFSIAKHFHGKGAYSHNFKEGLSVVDACLRIVQVTKPKWWALENPNGYLKRWLGVPDYQFEPWEFGDPYRKTTNLWGCFTQPVKIVEEMPEGLIKFSLMKSKDIAPEFFGRYNRQERRAVTPKGFAKAFFEANR